MFSETKRCGGDVGVRRPPGQLVEHLALARAQRRRAPPDAGRPSRSRGGRRGRREQGRHVGPTVRRSGQLVGPAPEVALVVLLSRCRSVDIGVPCRLHPRNGTALRRTSVAPAASRRAASAVVRFAQDVEQLGLAAERERAGVGGWWYARLGGGRSERVSPRPVGHPRGRPAGRPRGRPRRRAPSSVQLVPRARGSSAGRRTARPGRHARRAPRRRRWSGSGPATGTSSGVVSTRSAAGDRSGQQRQPRVAHPQPEPRAQVGGVHRGGYGGRLDGLRLRPETSTRPERSSARRARGVRRTPDARAVRPGAVRALRSRPRRTPARGRTCTR